MFKNSEINYDQIYNLGETSLKKPNFFKKIEWSRKLAGGHDCPTPERTLCSQKKYPGKHSSAIFFGNEFAFVRHIVSQCWWQIWAPFCHQCT